MDILEVDEQYLLNLIKRSHNTLLCRCCLSECGDGVSLFAELTISNGMFSVDPAGILMSCFGIIVTKHDSLPQILCRDCLTSAKSTYVFKKRCEKAIKMLNIRRTLAENDEIITKPFQKSTRFGQKSIENNLDNRIILDVNQEKKIRIDRSPYSCSDGISSKLKRGLSVLNECSNFLKTPIKVQSVIQRINIRRESVNYNARKKRSHSRNTDIFSESVSRLTIGSQAFGKKREWSSRETLKSVNSKKMLGRGYKMLQLALGHETVVDEPKPRVKNKVLEKNYDENRIKSYLKDVWRSRHNKDSPHKNRRSHSSPLSGVSLCSFELMTPPKHYFYHDINDVTNLGFTTPEKQIKKSGL